MVIFPSEELKAEFQVGVDDKDEGIGRGSQQTGHGRVLVWTR
jgi:hypothetical protein